MRLNNCPNKFLKVFSRAFASRRAWIEYRVYHWTNDTLLSLTCTLLSAKCYHAILIDSVKDGLMSDSFSHHQSEVCLKTQNVTYSPTEAGQCSTYGLIGYS